MRSIRVLLLMTLVPFLAVVSRGEDKKVTAEQIEQAISRLGDKRFAVREKAAKFLFEAGPVAEKQLEVAAKSEDTEVASRAGAILDRFAWGIYADSDPKLAAAVESFKKGDGPTRLEALSGLIQLRPVPFKAVRKLIASEEDATLRLQQIGGLTDFARAHVPEWIRDDRLDEVQETLELIFSAGNSDLAADYAVLMELRKRIDDGIARFEKQAEAKDETARAADHVLLHLYRIKGDKANAVRLARKDARPEIIEGLLFELSNWKELLQALPVEKRTETLGYRLHLARLAEDRDEQAAILKEIRDPKEKVEDDPGKMGIFCRAIGLTMNLYADEGIKLLVDSRTDMDTAFELLTAQCRYREALAAIDAATTIEKNHDRQVGLQIRRARLLYLLGDKDSAIQIFRKYGPRSGKNDPNHHMIYTLVKTEAQLGLRSLACEHIASYLANANENDRRDATETLCDYVFPSRGELARTAWLMLRQVRPNEEEAKTILRLRKLMERQGGDELESLTKLVENPPEPPERGIMIDRNVGIKLFASTNGSTKVLTLAELYADHGLDETARKWFRRATDMNLDEAWLAFGDYLYGKKAYREAADAYAAEGKTARATRSKVLALALLGRCQRLLGDRKEGDRLVEQAHRMPLGNDHVRVQLMGEYRKRDWPEAARREAEMALRCGELGSGPSFTALHYLANATAHEKDYARSSDYYRRIVLGLLHRNGSFTEDSGYLTVPEAVELAHGQQLLKDGKIDEARKLAAESLNRLPGNIDTALAFVPELDRLKKTKEADAIYGPVRDVYLGILKDYPNSAYACNSLAWMQATCRRDLDDALKHAGRAVQREPENHGYLDTLAEVHFRRGEREKAMELMKKCISMEPRRRYYRMQLERFEKGSIDSDAPPDEEE